MNTKTVLIVGVGGALGSIARFLCSRYINETHATLFPWATFLINSIGCLLIGIFYAMSEKENVLSQEARFFLTTGFCGGFTTFSAFAYENINLLKTGHFIVFSTYTLCSVTLGLAATYIGMLLVKLF